ncbi:hypothetical protein FIBSPDRAFT_830544 [Athelia psychrophila]|uniref:TPR-like protein n=1 Tax=Athelia psychrophila TaxID=1759441 RepID=A0A166G6X5_9AGAM|nr:hypothetical protein FIBSPDRAFT_830544 [Fibularhizoctonia sp. CBS 109695]
MLSRIKNTFGKRKQLRLQDDHGSRGDRTTSTAIQAANTITFNTIGTSGPVMNVAGDLHLYSGPSAAADNISPPPPSQPSAPDIWFGRGDIVSTLAGVITGNNNPRIAILGSGGMGKTATALHLIRNEAVVARYGNRIFFVACDAATCADLLASRILQSMGVAAAVGENLVTAMHRALKAAPPTLLVLDNFESTWEGERDHAATRDLLQKTAECPSSTLIITMRATTPPPGIRWTFFDSLPPLPAASAKEVFLAINRTFCDGSDDGNEVLDELLKELDYVPLAIHLLAHVSTDYTPRYVLKQWKKQRTRMLSLDKYTNDKLESVDISISLSMDSLDVERNFEATQLLGMICLLPDGLLGWQERLEVIGETFDTATSDLWLLRKSALVYTTGGKLGVLSPIRHFVLQHYPPDAPHVQCIYNILWQLVHMYGTVEYGPNMQGAIDALSPEMGNIGNLIDHAVVSDHGERMVGIAIKISWHLRRTHPSSHLLHKVSGLVPSVPTEMQAQYWHVSGEIMYGQNEYADATSMLLQAQGLFLKVDDRAGAAQCSWSLGDILRMQSEYSEAAAVLTDAQVQFLEIRDRLGAARCSQSLGMILCMQSKYSEAAAILTNARDDFLEIGDHRGTALCSRSLGDILRMQNNYSEAAAVFTDAQAQFLDIGDRLGATNCSLILGNILSMQGNYSEAAAVLTNARGDFLEIGQPLGAAQCSLALGDNLSMQSEHSEAAAMLTDARSRFLDIGDRAGGAQSLRSLGQILSMQRKYSEAAATLTSARAEFLEIGQRLGAAQCSRALGDNLSMQSKHSEAAAILTDARAQFLQVNNRLGEAQCAQSLGKILLAQRKYTEAENILTHARDQFLDIGFETQAAYCSELFEEYRYDSDDGESIDTAS